MSICTFFGHSECYGLDTVLLRKVVETLIHQGVDTFYVGNQGQSDAIVYRTLRQLRAKYPHIRYAVVLAYLPTESNECEAFSDTIYPEGIEYGPAKFAIDRRNRWMLKEADYVVCYVRHSWGGAYKFFRLARKQGKFVLNLYDAKKTEL